MHMGRVLRTCKRTGSPKFRIPSVRQDRRSQNQLLAFAVADATKKTLILSKAVGVSLQVLETVDYSWGKMKFESSPISKLSQQVLLAAWQKHLLKCRIS